jgi:hypothetical protein
LKPIRYVDIPVERNETTINVIVSKKSIGNEENNALGETSKPIEIKKYDEKARVRGETTLCTFCLSGEFDKMLPAMNAPTEADKPSAVEKNARISAKVSDNKTIYSLEILSFIKNLKTRGVNLLRIRYANPIIARDKRRDIIIKSKFTSVV